MFDKESVQHDYRVLLLTFKKRTLKSMARLSKEIGIGVNTLFKFFNDEDLTQVSYHKIIKYLEDNKINQVLSCMEKDNV